ncbi:MAG: hypothetical protein ACREHG_09695, partial [Candidatus Saccharimonadales bacterium]
MADLPSDGGGGGGFVGVAIGAIGSILGHDSNDNPPPIPPPNSGITYSELLAWLLAHGARVFDIDHQTSRPMTQADVTAALEANPAGIEGYPEPQAGSNTGLAQAINEHIDTLGNILKAAITSGIAGNNAAVLGAISASTQAITGAIQQGNAQQTSVLTGATGSILDKLGQTAKGILDTLGNVFGNSTDIIQQALQGNITLTEALERAALAAIQKTVDDQTTTIATAIKKVNDAAAGQITQATHANEAVSQAIIDALKQQG